MKILKPCVQFWKICGAFLSASSSESDFYLSLLSIFVLINDFQTFSRLSVCYIVIEEKAAQISHLVYSVLQICGTSVAFGPYVSAIFARGKIGAFVGLLEQVVGTSKKLSKMSIRVIMT